MTLTAPDPIRVGADTPDLAPLPDSAGTPERLWAAFAPAIAGQLRVRIARDRVSYRQAWERSLDPEGRPRLPAAVRLYGRDGRARCLALDLDVGRGGHAQVAADTDRLLALVAAVGGRAFVDESPTGGRHVYLPLHEPVALAELRPVLRSLAALAPSLDLTPMLNAAAGCIRPPGAAHRAGGTQRLLTPLPQARDAALRGNSPRVWRALSARLAPRFDDPTPPAGSADPDELDEPAAARRPAQPLSADYLRLARTGDYSDTAYRTGSEARQAVLTSAAARGWRLVDVIRHLETGAWPGLAGLYGRYRSGWRTALCRDWRKAGAFLAARERVSNSPTRESYSHPPIPDWSQTATTNGDDHGGERDYVFLRQWWTALTLASTDRYGSRAGLTLRAVLYAIGAAAQKRGHRYVAFGTRSLSLGSARDHTTVAAALRALRGEADPFLVLLDGGRGPAGDRYELRIPDVYLRRAETRRWPVGRLPQVDSVFGELGLPAFFAHTALDQAPRTVSDLEDRAGLPRPTLYRALDVLADHGLAQRVSGGWRLGRSTLHLAGERLGIPELVTALLAKIRRERAAWWARLGLVRRGPSQADDAAGSPGRSESGPSPPEDWSGMPLMPPADELPPDEPYTVLDLLHDVLGAVPIPPGG